MPFKTTAIVSAALFAAAALPVPAGANDHPIRPRGGAWHGAEKSARMKLSFNVSKDGKHVQGFVVRMPYTCANGGSGTLVWRHPKRVKINSFNGYFYLGDKVPVSGITDGANFYLNGFFSAHGKRAAHASGDVGVSFDSVWNDYCTDRFDKWTAGG